MVTLWGVGRRVSTLLSRILTAADVRLSPGIQKTAETHGIPVIRVVSTTVSGTAQTFWLDFAKTTETVHGMRGARV
jgi:hypothetical protein